MIGIGDSAAKPDIGLGYQLPLLYACALSSEPMYDVPYSVVLAPEFDILSKSIPGNFHEFMKLYLLLSTWSSGYVRLALCQTDAGSTHGAALFFITTHVVVTLDCRPCQC